MSFTAIASFPKTKSGRIDFFELCRMCAKFDIDINAVEELEPYELLLTLEGRIEQQREYFEFLSYSLYNAVGQVLSTKNKQFENPFEKKETKKQEKPSKEVQAHTMDVLENIFGINTNKEEEESVE